MHMTFTKTKNSYWKIFCPIWASWRTSMLAKAKQNTSKCWFQHGKIKILIDRWFQKVNMSKHDYFIAPVNAIPIHRWIKKYILRRMNHISVNYVNVLLLRLLLDWITIKLKKTEIFTSLNQTLFKDLHSLERFHVLNTNLVSARRKFYLFFFFQFCKAVKKRITLNSESVRSILCISHDVRVSTETKCAQNDESLDCIILLRIV